MAAAITAATRGWGTTSTQPRIAFGGIGIECSTYSRIRTRIEDFDILKGQKLLTNQRFAFLKRYNDRYRI